MTQPTSNQLYENLKVPGVGQVINELDHFRRQSQRLELMNKLHTRLAGVLDLAGMIESYSVWLTPYVGHELIAYNNATKQKKHMFCSGHGPSRRSIMAFAETLLDKSDYNTFTYRSEDGHYAHKWLIETADDAGLLLILKDEQELADNEINLINESLVILSESLRRALEYEELFESSRKDVLTGLYNRRVFDERITVLMESSKRYGHPLSIASLDLDRFKQVNDKLGHQMGDTTLQHVARVFEESIRSTDLVIRMGGDEFFLIMENTDQKSGRILAERICKAVDSLSVWADEHTKLGVSIGLAEWKQEEGLNEWLERVDDYLYHSKIEGRARVTCG